MKIIPRAARITYGRPEEFKICMRPGHSQESCGSSPAPLEHSNKTGNPVEE